MGAPATRGLIGTTLLLLISASGWGLLRAGIYGWTIFVVYPVALGGLASWVFRPLSGARAVGIGVVVSIVGLGFLLVLRMEGFICILMALPIVTPLIALGAWLVYWAEKLKLRTRGLAMLLLMPPATLTWDAKAPPELFAVRTAIEVSAPPERVWKHVVSFSVLPEPRDWFFRSGLAYPKRARMVGSGAGATRYCEFSTGAFVEPIEVWDEPRLLRFRVAQNPAPMDEWSFYGKIEPKHLHGYMVSKRGQFRLTRMANGHTMLEGTTWYRHGLWPAQYWRWWSDAIVHRIHLRVLNHVRTLAEG